MSEQWGSWNTVDLSTVELFYSAQYSNGKISSADGPAGYWEFSTPDLVVDFANLLAYQIELDVVDVVEGGWLGVYSMVSAGPDASSWWYLHAKSGTLVPVGTTVITPRIHPAYEDYYLADYYGEDRVLIEGGAFAVAGMRWRSAVAVEPTVPTGTVVGAQAQYYAEFLQSGTESAETDLVGHSEGAPGISNSLYTRSAFWRWTAFETGRVKVEMENLDYGTISTRKPLNIIYNAATNAQLASDTSTTFFDAVRGQTYEIRLATDTASETARHVVRLSAVQVTDPVRASDDWWANNIVLQHNPLGVNSWCWEPRILGLSEGRALATWWVEDNETAGETWWKLYGAVISPGSPITAGTTELLWVAPTENDYVGWFDMDYSVQSLGNDRALVMFTYNNSLATPTTEVRLLLVEVGATISILDEHIQPEPYVGRPVMCSYLEDKAVYSCTGAGPTYGTSAHGYRAHVVDCAGGTITVGAGGQITDGTQPPGSGSTEFYNFKAVDVKVGSDGHGALISEGAYYVSFTIASDVVASVNSILRWEGYGVNGGLWGTDAVHFDAATNSILMAAEDSTEDRQVPGRWNHDPSGNWTLTERGDTFDYDFTSSFLGSGGRWLHVEPGPDGTFAMWAMRDRDTPEGVFYYDVFSSTPVRVPAPNTGTWVDIDQTFSTDFTVTDSGFYGIVRGDAPSSSFDWNMLVVAYFAFPEVPPEPVIVLSPPTARRRFTRSRGRW